jgi:hypothetical protein
MKHRPRSASATEGSDAFYPAALPLSRQTLTYTARIIRRHRKRICSCWRRLDPGRQALLVLAYLRRGETFAELAARFGVSTATASRYVIEMVDLLAAPCPRSCPRPCPRPSSRARLRGDRRRPHPYRLGRGGPAVLVRQAPPARHEPAGHRQPWRRGPVGVWRAARRRARPDYGPDLGHRGRAGRLGLVILADQDYIGAGEQIRTPYRGRNKPASRKDVNRSCPAPRPRRTRQRPAQDLAYLTHLRLDHWW